MKLNFKKLHPDAVIPTRGTPDSAGLDLCAVLDKNSLMRTSDGQELKVIFDGLKDIVVIPPHSTLMVRTGLAVQPSQNDIALLLYPRSGLSVKHGIILANSIGVIDSDYRGEMMIPLYNNSEKSFTLKSGDRIAQLVITPVLFPEIEEVTDINETVRSASGFGSTGI